MLKSGFFVFYFMITENLGEDASGYCKFQLRKKFFFF